MMRSTPILPIDDLQPAKTFYVDGLGFKTTFEATEDGHSGLIGLERDGAFLTLDSPMDGHGRCACFSLEVEDVDALHAEWRSRIEVEDAPKDEPWGARTFGLQDPSGNTIFVLGPTKASHP